MTSPSPSVLHMRPEEIWPKLHREADETSRREPTLADTLQTFVTGRADLSDALGLLLAEGLATALLDATQLRGIIAESHAAEPGIVMAAQYDLLAVLERDPVATNLLVPFLFFKGFHALQAYRVAHWLWKRDQKIMAYWFQSQLARNFAVDIHPAAVIGKGIMMDHAHGIVIGETAVLEDNVSLVHDVTLGGTGKERGDRHPKIRTGVMIGAGAIVLGNIEVGAGARIAAGSVVLHNVPPHTTVAGVPARVIGSAGCASPAEEMDQMLRDMGSSI